MGNASYHLVPRMAGTPWSSCRDDPVGGACRDGRLPARSRPARSTSRGLDGRLRAIENGQERADRALRDEMARARAESAAGAKELREEVLAGLTQLGDLLSASMARVSDVQRDGLESFAQRLASLSESNERKLEALRAGGRGAAPRAAGGQRRAPRAGARHGGRAAAGHAGDAAGRVVPRRSASGSSRCTAAWARCRRSRRASATSRRC